MTAKVMAVDIHEALDIDIEDDDPERGKHEFWEGLKRKLDDELTSEEFQRVLYLVKDKIGEEIISEREIHHPSDLLNILENNMLKEDALSTIQHVFSVMDTYPEYEEKGFGQIVTDHMSVRKQFGCPNITGREKKIKKVFKWLKKSEVKGVWIHGAGGLGKTLLAREVCIRLFSQNVTIIPIDLKHVTSSVEFVWSILSKLGIYVTNSDLKNLTTELIYQLKRIARDTCILLDNIEDVYQFNEDEVLDILHRLWDSPEYMPVKWIVTSKVPIQMEKEMKIKSLQLRPLRRESAKTLLQQSCRGVNLTDSRCQILLNMAGDVPLAIRLLSSALKSDSLDRLTDNQLRELLNPQLHNAIQDCIQYSYRLLTEQEKFHLHMLSVVETSQFDIETVKAVLDAEEEEAVFLMMKLTNRQIVQRISSGQMEEVRQKQSSGLQYCIHPLIFEYIRNLPVPQEYIVQAQSNFCKHMIQKMEPSIANCDGNYMEAIRLVSNNRPLLKVMFNVLSMGQNDTENLFTSNRNIYLSKLQEMLQMTRLQKEQLYRNITEQLKSSHRKHALVFWKLEEVRMMVDCQRFSDAETAILSLETTLLQDMANDESATYLKGRFWYVKGRLFRLKKEKLLGKAMECFRNSLITLQNTQYIPDATMALNAIGNVYFDQGDYDKALASHVEAGKTLRNFISEKIHPEVAIYEFNAGTIYLAKARQDLNINKCVTEEASRNFQKALEIFQDSMEMDVQMGTCRMPQYASKLAQRAQALFHLGRHEDAIADMKRSLDIKLAPFEGPDKNTTIAYFKCGRTFLDWRQRLQQGTEVAKLLLREATLYFRRAEEEMKSNREACLTGTDKSSFIDLYRQIAKNVKKEESKIINAFCERFQRGVTVDSSPSSSSTEEPSPSSQVSSDSDEGIGIDDDGNNNDTNDHGGIPSAHAEKQQASQFEQGIFAEIDAQISGSEINAQISGSESKKRRRISSSESD